jgi:hypothetical protein
MKFLLILLSLLFVLILNNFYFEFNEVHMISTTFSMFEGSLMNPLLMSPVVKYVVRSDTNTFVDDNSNIAFTEDNFTNLYSIPVISSATASTANPSGAYASFSSESTTGVYTLEFNNIVYFSSLKDDKDKICSSIETINVPKTLMKTEMMFILHNTGTSDMYTGLLTVDYTPNQTEPINGEISFHDTPLNTIDGGNFKLVLFESLQNIDIDPQTNNFIDRLLINDDNTTGYCYMCSLENVKRFCLTTFQTQLELTEHPIYMIDENIYKIDKYKNYVDHLKNLHLLKNEINNLYDTSTGLLFERFLFIKLNNDKNKFMTSYEANNTAFQDMVINAIIGKMGVTGDSVVLTNVIFAQATTSIGTNNPDFDESNINKKNVLKSFIHILTIDNDIYLTLPNIFTLCHICNEYQNETLSITISYKIDGGVIVEFDIEGFDSCEAKKEYNDINKTAYKLTSASITNGPLFTESTNDIKYSKELMTDICKKS